MPAFVSEVSHSLTWLEDPLGLILCWVAGLSGWDRGALWLVQLGVFTTSWQRCPDGTEGVATRIRRRVPDILKAMLGTLSGKEVAPPRSSVGCFFYCKVGLVIGQISGSWRI
jgi:hypothetical protein